MDMGASVDLKDLNLEVVDLISLIGQKEAEEQEKKKREMEAKNRRMK